MNRKEKALHLYQNKDYILKELRTRTQQDVADEFGVFRTTLRRACKRWEQEGYELFNTEKSAAKPILMGRQDTPEYYYWLGILATDGNLFRSTRKGKFIDSNYSRITLALTDEDVVQKFATFCDYPARTISVRRGAKDTHKDTYIYAQIISEEEADYLESLGITPNKSKTLQVSDYLLHNPNFLRGVIDGDGHFHIRDRGSKGYDYQLGISTGSEAFANQIVDTFQRLFSDGKINPDRRRDSITYRVYTNKKQTLIDALTLIYKDAPENLRMERKYQKAMEIIRNYDFVMSP